IRLAQGSLDEGTRCGTVERLALGELLRVLEERHEQLTLIDGGAQGEARLASCDIAPGGADFRPERLRALQIGLAGAEVEVLDALVARDTVFTPDVGQLLARFSALVQHQLEVVFLLYPAGRRDRKSIGAY